MKKTTIAFLLLVLVIGEVGCVVRVKERRRPAPPPHGVVY